MAHILMIQLQPAPYAGTAYLCGAAKAAGHEFSLLIHTDPSAGKLNARIAEIKPDIIGFSCMTGFHLKALRLIREIRQKHDIPVIMGGAHPTLFPEVLNEPGVDIICRGEGEYALVDLLNAMDAGAPFVSIPNLSVKSKGTIHRNEVRPLADPLDALPLIDWSCYKGTVVQKSPPVVFPIRGCPYSCSYCFNASVREMYRDKGPYVRYFSAERAIKETKAALDFFEPQPVLFASDTFGVTHSKWLGDVLRGYAKLTDLPFVMLLRPEVITDELVAILAAHNCHAIAMGVESGSERVRKEILNRHYSNELLVNAADKLHRAGIKFRTYNIIGLPGETAAEIEETIDINIKMRTDFPRAAIFVPFPDTEIVEKAKALGLLDASFSFDSVPNSILDRTVLKLDDADKNRIQNTLYFFQSMVIFPRVRKLLGKFTGIPSNAAFRAWFYLVYAYLHRKSEGRSVFGYMRYIFANRKDL